MTDKQRILLWLVLFAIAMAYFEAALVVHLRNLYYPENPQEIFPLHLMTHADLTMELVREVATVIMIIMVALLAVRDTGRRFAAFVFLFGVWDIFYYIWLKVLIGWPQDWLEWDVLYLIPWIWLGPWITAAFIALLFIGWGGYVLLTDHRPRFNRMTVGLFISGAIAGVAAFLWPAAKLLPEGEQAFTGYQPGNFPWLLYIVGLLTITVGLTLSLRKHSH